MSGTTLLNGEMVQSIFASITRNDTNARSLLEIIGDESDLSELVEKTSPQHGGLSAYLHAVYENAETTQAFLLGKTFGQYARSVLPNEARHRLTSEQTKKMLSVDGGNDVCWAILSSKPETLSTLVKTYQGLHGHLAVNEKKVSLASTEGFRNETARKLTPLDLAVQFYVAQKIQDQCAIATQKNLAKALESQVNPIIKLLERSGLQIDAAELVIPEPYGTNPDIVTTSQQTAAKIHQLIQLGAKGSYEAYFPIDDGSIADPLNNREGFEVMSLSNFCQLNRSLFSEDLYKAIKSCSAIPAPSPKG